MCGRYSLAAVTIDFMADYGVETLPDMPVPNRYNIAPTQPVLIVREDRLGGSGHRELAHVVWGLIPSWADSPALASKMINARAETAAEKPAYRNAYKRRRCLIPATGFYEWRALATPADSAPAPSADLFGSAPPAAPPPLRKVPYYFSLADSSPFAFAGLWEIWNGPDGEQLESCTILTTRANDLMAAYHDRMPVILPRNLYDPWLDPALDNPRDIQPMLQSFPPEKMKVHQVSPRVNSPRNDSPELIEPV